MADEGTVSTLILIGAIIQFFFMISFLTLGLISVPFSIALFALDPFLGSRVLAVVIVYLIFGFLGIIFFILWFRWRSEPSIHKKALIITGILGLLLAGVLPGLLVLIGGVITKVPRESPDL